MTQTEAVAVLLASPLAGVLAGGRTLREIAADAVAGLRLVEAGGPIPDDAVLVVVDPACPEVPAPFVGELVDACARTGRVQVAVLAVTDTIKMTEGASVGETLDRDSLAMVASPVVLPPGVRSHGRDVVAIVDEVRAGHAIDLVEAPPGVVRLIDADDVVLLAASAT